MFSNVANKLTWTSKRVQHRANRIVKIKSLKFAISFPAIITGHFKYTNSSKHLVIKFANYNLARVSFSCVNKAVTVAVKKGG